MGTRLRDMIRAVRACKTAAEERGVIAKECANLRNSFKENDQDYRHRNVAKLMFIHMLGYPTHFGQMECLKLIASGGFPEKRIGYLGLMLLLDERQEVLMLVTNSLKNDLNHGNQFIAGLALCALGNICSAEMARDLAPEVEKLLHNNNSYIRKKAALCSVRIVRKVPDLVEYFTNPAVGLLTDKHHGVLIAGVKLCTELCQGSEAALEQMRKQVQTLVRILKNLVVSGYAPEYDVGGITDPFLQIRILRLLRLVGRGDPDSSDVMSDILAQVATNTEGNKNAGNAILYECVLTIMAIEGIGGLRVLAINILGRFLANRDNNIRYVALNTLVKVVSVDTQAVQRHRTTIVECVKDSDVSIRRRALELVYALVNETNVKTLTKELLEYLKVSDPEFKADLTAKICSLVQKFAPNKQWYIDQMILVMAEPGNHVREEVLRTLIVVISNAPELHGYTVRSLFRTMQHWNGQESLAQVTVWCIGEYGEMLVNHLNELEGEEPLTVTESDAVDVIETVMKDVRSSSNTQAFALTALLKLSSRFPSNTQRIKDMIKPHKGSLILELQQRSIEFGAILNRHENIKATLVERMPVLDEATYNSKKADGAGMALPSDTKRATPVGGPDILANGGPKPETTNTLIDLLNLDADETPAHEPRKSAGDHLLSLLGADPLASQNASTNPDNVLMDILSLGSPAPTTGPSSSTSLFPPAAADPFGGSLLDVAAPAAPVDPFGASLAPATGTAPRKTSLLDELDVSSTVPQPPRKASLLDDLGPTIPNANNSLLDGLDSAPIVPATSAYPTIVALQSSGLKVLFDFIKPPGNPQSTTIKASYINLSSNPYTDFIFQAAVPKFLQLQLEPASGSVLPASGGGLITQSINLTNTMHGQKSLLMKLRIIYKINGQDKVEQGQVSNFPQGL
ncbi:AP-1 complex subunit gamma-1 [Marchantia polymorpha subsp. ruderalis]|uniref:AP-1 complex subunit gamma n=1 Tax=Marchantia polymorpha TaxID=3197 RepID=A0A2R6W898_MARPO|nr:hypothetical protein MARPO_0130s0022 [Marchantia polymorpha]BBN00790.1 hypothetical protein Mp_2g02140 [Marchantia polymorpha subsp. ruderalis]|eukprot:PTQ30067.1 hypothetical protein MARPO_0130s0022 [Marchantia polymorpha]